VLAPRVHVSTELRPQSPAGGCQHEYYSIILVHCEMPGDYDKYYFACVYGIGTEKIVGDASGRIKGEPVSLP
jgi:hypothetical protein